MTDRVSLLVPPVIFEDDEGREIHITEGDDEQDPLIEMYDGYASEHRAQGLPPTGRNRIAEWLETIDEGIEVLAWHAGRAVGHAALLEGEADHELMIFVHQDYRLAGIGSRLIRALLGYGKQEGVEAVWLCVRPSNTVAIALYRSVGFDAISSHETDLEMTLSLNE